MIRHPDIKRKSVEVVKYINELKISPSWVERVERVERVEPAKRIKTGAFNSNY